MPEQDDDRSLPRFTRQMAALGGDPHRMLRGENPDTPYADDARHWIAVYRELLGFKQDLLRTLRSNLGAASEEASQELLETDIPMMEAEAARFEHRIAFWEGRLRELGGGAGSSGHA